MDKTPKAIETEYNGYRFRSKLEARWAVLFDALNIEYEYEPEGFELSDGTRYLPDFYFPRFEMYAEVKPPREGALEELIKPLKCVEEQVFKRIVFLSNIPYDERENGHVWWYPFAYYNNLSRGVSYARVGIDAFIDEDETQGYFLDYVYMCHWKSPCYWAGSFFSKEIKERIKNFPDLLIAINDLDMPYPEEIDGSRFTWCGSHEDENDELMLAYKKARSARFGQKRKVA